jgi:electron transfer flavoprotein alpha subunit
MPILVFAEQRAGKFRKAAYEAVSEGRRLADKRDDRLFVSIMGSEISGLTKEISRYGPDEILLTDNSNLSFYNTETYGACLSASIKEVQPNLVMFAHTAMGKDLAPRVAERVGAGLASDCIAMSSTGEEIYFIRPMYAGKVLAKITIATAIKMATLRPNNFPIEERHGQAEVRTFTPEIPIPRAKVSEVNLQDSTRLDLTEADIIVSGGRGLGNAEGFQVIEQLADRLGAALGASRAAVDAGWQEQQYQVGQTGKVVTPNLYIACGISGAIQHLAGMGQSKCIVAINTDPDANIMKIADLAIQGDLYEVIPEMVKQLKELQAKISN